jgi:DNA polymerase-1
VTADVVAPVAVDEGWPEVVVPGGEAAAELDRVDRGVTASPPVPETAGQGPALVDESVDVAFSRRPGPRPARPSAGRPVTPPPAAARPDKAAETTAGAPSGFDVCTSVRCRAKIRWARTMSGDRMPVDYAPDPLGNLVWTMKSKGDWRLREITASEEPDVSLKRWTSHFASCPEATRFRRRDQGRPAARPRLEVVPPAAPGVLLAVDGNSLAHRAFHAYEKSGMRTPDGRPLWAVYGFLALLVGIIDRTTPDAVVVGFDDPGVSLRRDRYPEYKAGRPERSEDLYAQMTDIAVLLGELGVSVVTPAGLEADDVLASAAVEAERDGWRCVVATSDKDAFGLITEATTVLRLVSGLDNAVELTPGVLLEQYGVTPAQWRDYTALVGDKSDNLPGVLGVGPKTAVKLLAACGTLDAALADPGAAVAAVGKAPAAKLATDAAAEAIARNRDLMAPVSDLPIGPAGCRPSIAGGEVAKVLRDRHLPSLIERTVAVLARPTPVAAARLAPVRESKTAPAQQPAWSEPAPTLEVLGSDQDETDRTCPGCAAVCPARVPLAGDPDGPGVLVAEAAPLGDVLMVSEGGRWVAQRISGYVGDISNRRREHACTVYGGTCVTPGHGDRRARPYPGGWFCDGCAGNRGRNQAT